ncbi:MAG: DNA-binding protein [Acidobacteria bacterium 13_1_20CM_2_65_9]|nr:MAG: DNA-binding protein [Acidobacteria bacterium 13_1_20CM_2_65_9]
MTNTSLAASYIVKARKRLKALEVLFAEEAYSDVVREAQEIVELALKAALRVVGVDPPKIHDVGRMIDEHRDRFPEAVAAATPRLVEISAWLRKEREFAFYGDIDFIPTEQYTRAQAERALEDARFVVDVVGRLPMSG